MATRFHSPLVPARVRRLRRGAALIAVGVLLTAGRSLAQDHQVFPLGQGLREAECVSPGPNLTLNSIPTGDDKTFGQSVLSGKNGICETPLSGDDVRPQTGITLGKGAPNAGLVLAGTPGSNNGICDDVITPLGDDVVRTPAGQSEPRQVAITVGTNGVINSIVAGDDVSTAVVCPGIDGILQSAGTVNPADQVVVNNQICITLCGQSTACIIPGTDDVLQSSTDSQDVTVFYVSSGANGVGQTATTGDDFQRIAVGFGFTELDTVCVTSGPDGLAQTTLCGNAIDDFEENGIVPNTGECDDGNLLSGDGCDSNCTITGCGNGIVTAGETCEDGNTNNDDACVGCQDARCGDGFKQRSVEECDDGCLVGTPNVCEPADDGDGCSSACVEDRGVHCGDEMIDPGEECDDGNNSDRDDCPNTCKLAVCGDGRVHDKGTGTEQCDDDNTAPGDGCSPTCTLECGNGVLNGACSEGSVGAPCSTNADCDTAPANGVCIIGEQCDPGKNCIGGSNNGAPCAAASMCPGGTCAPLFCIPDPQVCSAVCLISTCGNRAVECSEQCDLGSANGVSGSGCTAGCQRNLVGAKEVTGSKECPSAWTLDSAPQDLRFEKQVCTDGAPCDFDGAPNGRCAFRVGVCLNRPTPVGCSADGIQAFDLLRLKFRGICTAGRVGAKCFKSPHVNDCETSPGLGDGFCLSREADAAADITDAVRLLAPTIAKVPDRCRAGLKGKVCSIADDNECDRVFGSDDGLCDIGAGVEFERPLNAGDQETACTPSVDVVVDAGTRLKLFSHVRRTTGLPDIDKLLLVCAPAP